MTRASILVVTAAALLGACTPQPTPVDDVRTRGQLRVVTLNGPTSFYLGAHGPEGLEYELASAFAKDLRVGLAMYPVANVEAMRAELASGRADIAAAQLSVGDGWQSAGRRSNVYAWIPQLVVSRRDAPRLRNTLEMEEARFAVRAGSEQERMLEHLRRTVVPDLRWISAPPETADPLEEVTARRADHALIDSREFTFARHLYANLRIAFALPQERPVQWVVRGDAPELHEAVNDFFRRMSRSGELEQLMARTSGDARKFAYEESLRFQEHMASRLPQYRQWFEQAQRETGVDWRLLAAIGYQESKWVPTARSADDARGVMMLTADTAQEQGVEDRADPEQNILAGARYFVQVREKIPQRIPEPDRTWLAVAAYNVGFGHLEDARIITQMHGKNPDSWDDVRLHLPLLTQERWYVRVKRGYARGWEPQQFVDRVQRFLKLLEWREPMPGGTPLPAGAPGPATAPAPATTPGVAPATTPVAAQNAEPREHRVPS